MSLTRAFANWFSNYSRADSPASRLRAKRIVPLLRLIESVHREYGFVRLIDLGGTSGYWRIVPKEFLDRHKVTICIVNLPGTGKSEKSPIFDFLEADGCDLSNLENNAFHIAHSNSVIEHVGDWARMQQFAKEVARVAPRYFVQTPNFWFPIEPHCMTPFFHWLPKPVRVWLVLHFQLGHWRKANSIDEAMQIVESAQLLNRSRMKSLFSDARILTERYFMLPKSFMALKE